MLPTLAETLPLLVQYGYFFLFLIAIIEGPIITILGAFLAAQGEFSVWLVFIVVVLGDLAGDVLYYGIGRYGAKAQWLLRLTGLTSERLTRLKEYFQENGGKALFFAKYTQTGFLALPAAGVIRMPFGKFFWFNVLGTLPKSFLFVIVGYFFGYAYSQINVGLERLSFVLAAIAFGVIIYLYQKRRSVKKTPSSLS